MKVKCKPFPQRDKRYCENWLTEGKLYEVIRQVKDSIEIINDNGHKEFYSLQYFDVIKEVEK